MKTGKKRISFFTAGVLIIIAGALFSIWGEEPNPILEKDSAQTLYASVTVGERPNLHAEDYFEEGVLEADRLTYDMAGCDLNTPGIYRIPVLYDGEETNCVFELTVEPAERETGFPIPEGGNLPSKIRISE